MLLVVLSIVSFQPFNKYYLILSYRGWEQKEERIEKGGGGCGDNGREGREIDGEGTLVHLRLSCGYAPV